MRLGRQLIPNACERPPVDSNRQSFDLPRSADFADRGRSGLFGRCRRCFGRRRSRLGTRRFLRCSARRVAPARGDTVLHRFGGFQPSRWNAASECQSQMRNRTVEAGVDVHEPLRGNQVVAQQNRHDTPTEPSAPHVVRIGKGYGGRFLNRRCIGRERRLIGGSGLLRRFRRFLDVRLGFLNPTVTRFTSPCGLRQSDKQDPGHEPDGTRSEAIHRKVGIHRREPLGTVVNYARSPLPTRRIC